MNVLINSLALGKSVKIHASILAVQTLTVMSQITLQSVCAQQDLLEIHSLNVLPFQVRSPRSKLKELFIPAIFLVLNRNFRFLILVVEINKPCSPTPCGANAVCKEQGNAGSCSCLRDYTGNPYEGCRPECIMNSDCSANLVCTQNKCRDPCPGSCGQNALCQVVNHSPLCTCIPGYTGNPFSHCIIQQPRKTKF